MHVEKEQQESSKGFTNETNLELVSKELNHLAAILHVYAGGLIFMKWKTKKYYILFFKKKREILLHF